MPPDTPLLHVVLYQPEIPYNTGSVGRTCVALGAKLWLVRPLGFHVDDRQLRRAGLDYWQHLAWEVVDDWRQLRERLPTDRLWCFTKRGDRDYLDADFRVGDALVFGRESTGLPDDVLASVPGRRLRIETRPEVRSLNLSNSVAVAGFEARRQLRGIADAAGVDGPPHGVP
ncbi:MAG: tRNA (cytidine(34)-2'-O)-methyltransferase [Lacipirellulaceae bacterium]